MRSYKDLDVWKKGIDLTIDIYSLTNNFPKSELYGLTSQIRRASVSVPSNLAEGHLRDSTKEFLRFISISLGSLAEVNIQLIIVMRIGYLTDPIFTEVIQSTDELGRMIRGLQKSLKARLS
jgi:four helix bundle protein